MIQPNASTDAALWELEWRVASIVGKTFGFAPHEVRPADSVFDVFAGDSLDLIELVAALEEEFRVELPNQWWQEVFTRNRNLTIGDLALALGQLPAARPPLPALSAPLLTGVAERVPFLQMGGRASAWEWLNGPLYQRLGINQYAKLEYRRSTDGMRCIEMPAADVTPSSRDGSRALGVPVRPFLIDAEPVSNLAYARFLNSVGAVPDAILQEWCGTSEADPRGKQFGLRRGGWWRLGGRWAPLRTTERQPMILVSWYGAAAYALWAHRLDWRYYRGDGTIPTELAASRVDAPPPPRELGLPSELEWEYAARGPQPQRYPWGDAEPTAELLRVAQHQPGQEYTAESLPVAAVNDRLGMSPFGLHHVAGNVWQWCRDWYSPGSTPPGACALTGIRSERGGSWVGPARLAECGYRRGRPPLARGRCLGFRCVGGLDRLA